MTPVRVVALNAATPDAAAVLVVETLAGDRLIGFHIPPSEAARLARVLGLARCRRAPIYDLVRDLATSLGGRVSGAVLDARTEGICAQLLLTRTESLGEEIGIPCHPADAVGLAVQAAAPILATPAALACAVPPGPPRKPSEVSAWLERVRPVDFAGSERDAEQGPASRPE